MSETKYRNTRESALNKMGTSLPKALGGDVAKQKIKHRQKLRDLMKEIKK